MIPRFADTFYYLAMLSRRDAGHELAIQFASEEDVPTVTTAWVLTEVGDALARVELRAGFAHLLRVLRGFNTVQIIPPTADLFERGVRLYEARGDKSWGLTDCISFTIMRDMGIQDALTSDRHFEQAGFRCLLRQ